MDRTIKPSKRKYSALVDERKPVDSPARFDQTAGITAPGEASAQPGVSQEQVVEEGRQRLGNEKLEFEDPHVDHRPIKRLRHKGATIDAGDATQDHPTAAAGSSLRMTGINAIPAETFGLIGAYVGLNSLEEGTRELTKLRVLNRSLNASIDLLPELKKAEPTLHAVELTRRLIESAHIKRKRDDLSDYSAGDGKGDPESWTRGYLHGHVEDIYAVMKFSDPDYNSALLRAGLKDVAEPNLQSQGGMLYRFAVNAREFDRAEQEAIADASVKILESRKGGQVPAAKAFLHLKEHLQDDKALQSHIVALDPRISTQAQADPGLGAEFRRVFLRAEKERAVSEKPGVSAEAQQKDIDLHCMRDAAAYGQAHKSAWDHYRSEIAGKFKKASEAEVLAKAATGLRGTDEWLKTEDVALAVRDKFYGAMSYREAEKLLTIATRESFTVNEKRAVLLERSPRKDGRAD
ncbi:hypothetical protein [Rhizobium nepotum]|uniref:Uncharacterized protein n=1 Tax=Rhizobium nepotum 39/7 TaxID=1368418 RepID=A0ABR5CM16_9HYPH|nr:hypothetical protein [Rhizobium nepotum]KJF65770.1 hypothetical protein RS75_21515 [Rhizobium nepotum 39/7]